MKVWIAVAVVASVVGTVLADLSNLYQQPLWGTGAAQLLFPDTAYERVLYGAKVTFNEWNLFGSFLLIPFALGLWAWRRDGGRQWRLVAALGAMEFGLVAAVTRAAWLCMAGLIALWWTLRRPRWRQVSVLAAMLAAAFLLQALALGAVPLRSRIFEQRTNIAHRSAINRVTLDSWIGRATPGQAERAPAPTPSWLLGHGAGSVNGLSVIVPEGQIPKVWTGNVVLFVLHDSGLVGLATLVTLIVVVLRRAAHAMRRGDGASPLTVPLLASGATLCFAYQFTHGLWLMYPYVYLGLLTAATATDESSTPER
jgi:O-antigen ligase